MERRPAGGLGGEVAEEIVTPDPDPPGLVLGYIQDLELDTGGLFKSGAVLLDPRLNELHEVAVLVSLNPEQP